MHLLLFCFAPDEIEYTQAAFGSALFASTVCVCVCVCVMVCVCVLCVSFSCTVFVLLRCISSRFTLHYRKAFYSPCC